MLSAYSGARSTFGPSSRELVDSLPPTRRELADGQRAQALGPSTAPQHRPQTAGYLGLHETRLVDVGLGGALTGSRRFGMPLQNMYILGNEEPGGCQRRSSAGLVEAPSSQVVSRKSHRAGELKRKNSRRSKSTSDAWTAMAASSTSQRGAGDGSEMDVAAGGKAEEPAVLPRVLMAFGAVAVASQLWPRSAA
ncbi:hypothetical protein P8C59_007403 [Phyllachora maydis]|uniref:Uncharacterized protein n=1 Tax=Phyllachora maydis TaxID=1825666 RepID=A0AAD9MI65_9PEZI|nr:hypothetical protein P8C59_007403 [Phyllachora maydis]